LVPRRETNFAVGARVPGVGFGRRPFLLGEYAKVKRVHGGAYGMVTAWNLNRWVRDDEIVVSLPGTSYAVAYYKPGSSPQLLARHLPPEGERSTLVNNPGGRGGSHDRTA